MRISLLLSDEILGSFQAPEGMSTEAGICEFAKLACILREVCGNMGVAGVTADGGHYATMVVSGFDWAVLGKEFPVPYSGARALWKILCQGHFMD